MLTVEFITFNKALLVGAPSPTDCVVGRVHASALSRSNFLLQPTIRQNVVVAIQLFSRLSDEHGDRRRGGRGELLLRFLRDDDLLFNWRRRHRRHRHGGAEGQGIVQLGLDGHGEEGEGDGDIEKDEDGEAEVVQVAIAHGAVLAVVGNYSQPAAGRRAAQYPVEMQGID